jgi:hypothetical protein
MPKDSHQPIAGQEVPGDYRIQCLRLHCSEARLYFKTTFSKGPAP